MALGRLADAEDRDEEAAEAERDWRGTNGVISCAREKVCESVPIAVTTVSQTMRPIQAPTPPTGAMLASTVPRPRIQSAGAHTILQNRDRNSTMYLPRGFDPRTSRESRERSSGLRRENVSTQRGTLAAGSPRTLNDIRIREHSNDQEKSRTSGTAHIKASSPSLAPSQAVLARHRQG